MTVESDTVSALSNFWDREPEDDALWEPWHPAVGQSVRINLSSECRQMFYLLDQTGRISPDKCVGHGWGCHGDHGYVIEINRGPGALGEPANGHFYWVECMHGFEEFAAAELEPWPADHDMAFRL